MRRGIPKSTGAEESPCGSTSSSAAGDLSMDALHTCNRVSDLKKHMDKVHTGMEFVLPNGYFTESAGFYLACHPVDYAKLVKPVSPESQCAVSAMEAVKCWLAAGLSPRSLGQWELGWCQAVGTPLQSEGACTPLTASHLDDRPVVTASLPVEAACYSPSRPAMGKDCAIKGHYLQDGARIVLLSLDGFTYMVTLNGTAKASDSVNKLLTTLPVLTAPEHTSRGPTQAQKAAQVTDILENNYGISEHLVDNVQECWVRPPPVYKPSPKMPKREESASDLLSHGVMPLVPPARREWEADGVINFQSGTQTISWPPTGWKKMTPERRLLVAEYAAMQLDAGEDGYPSTPRDQLLAVYNFLVLPGSAMPTSSVQQKMWYYNYAMLCDIVKQDCCSVPFVDMLRAASVARAKGADRFIRQMDAAGIKMRIA